ncbi:FHA domain-containing protein [bacterium]|nr:FHA domain-containing protein [bacterium]
MQIGGLWNQGSAGRIAPLAQRGSLPVAAESHELTSDQVRINQQSPGRYLQLPDGNKIGLPEQGRFQMGRHKDCQVPLEGDLVSRNHCQGEVRNGQLWVQDTSSNGTFVNGEQIPAGQWVEVRRGSELGFGQSVHTFRLGDDLTQSGQMQGPNGQTFDWPEGQQTVKVGRAKDSHLQPEDHLVSGNHALLRRTEGKLMVLDTQSRNGTFVNGERLESMRWTEIPAGAQLAFGDPGLAWNAPPP